jgi:TonB-dependent starch-binding outer membrane protein SusC
LFNAFSWKSLTLSFNIIYKGGHYFRRTSIEYSPFVNDWKSGHKDFYLRWQKPGDEQFTNVLSSLTFLFIWYKSKLLIQYNTSVLST